MHIEKKFLLKKHGLAESDRLDKIDLALETALLRSLKSFHHRPHQSFFRRRQGLYGGHDRTKSYARPASRVGTQISFYRESTFHKPNWELNMNVIHTILQKLNIEKDMLYLFNKTDKVQTRKTLEKKSPITNLTF